MAVVNEYECLDCGFEVKDDGRVFIWDDETGETKDFLILMNTYQRLNGARISGKVDETYCSGCERFLKIYSITQVADGIKKPHETVMKGIKKHISIIAGKLQKLKDVRRKSKYTIRKEDYYYIVEIPEYPDFYYSSYLFPEMTREDVIEDALKDFHDEIDEDIKRMEEIHNKFLNSNYLIVECDGGQDDDLSEKVRCPGCGKEVFKHISGNISCPKCGGKLFFANTTFYD